MQYREQGNLIDTTTTTTTSNSIIPQVQEKVTTTHNHTCRLLPVPVPVSANDLDRQQVRASDDLPASGHENSSCQNGRPLPSSSPTFEPKQQQEDQVNLRANDRKLCRQTKCQTCDDVYFQQPLIGVHKFKTKTRSNIKTIRSDLSRTFATSSQIIIERPRKGKKRRGRRRRRSISKEEANEAVDLKQISSCQAPKLINDDDCATQETTSVRTATGTGTGTGTEAGTSLGSCSDSSDEIGTGSVLIGQALGKSPGQGTGNRQNCLRLRGNKCKSSESHDQQEQHRPSIANNVELIEHSLDQRTDCQTDKLDYCIRNINQQQQQQLEQPRPRPRWSSTGIKHEHQRQITQPQRNRFVSNHLHLPLPSLTCLVALVALSCCLLTTTHAVYSHSSSSSSSSHQATGQAPRYVIWPRLPVVTQSNPRAVGAAVESAQPKVRWFSRRDAPGGAFVNPFAVPLPVEATDELSGGGAGATGVDQFQVQPGRGRQLPRFNGLPATTTTTNKQQAQDGPMPYKTFFVTQACEWKSNLFVPKSNDILFAQPQAPGSLTQSSVAYSSPSLRLQSGQVEFNQQQNAATNRQQQQQPDEQAARTIFSTTAKALILALPIEQDANFAGFEPACSIRLIAPRNMRILAKLTARKLSFEPQQQQQASEQLAPIEFLGANAGERQLWLNVSQSKFANELEERVLETETNVLAFRFLLERFASRLEAPELRFQVIVTAFQTLGENSDFSAGHLPSSAWPVGQQVDSTQQQFICDSQRLISANLACDGFKNCKDGHDEDAGVCAAFRLQQQQQQAGGQNAFNSAGDGGNNNYLLGQGRNQTLATSQQGTATTTTSSSSNSKEASWLGRLLTNLARDTSSLAGFLLGVLLILALLLCCTCCFYCLFLLLRNLTRRRDEIENSEPAASGSRTAQQRHLLSGRSVNDAASDNHNQRSRLLIERLRKFLNFKTTTTTRAKSTRGDELGSDSLARSQNVENAARLKAQALLNQQQKQPIAPTPPIRQIQSILKRPGAPLARFESIPQVGPPAPPPRLGQGQGERAVDVASPSAQQQQQQQQQQLPKVRGALASSLTSARESGRRITSSDFRPTPAARQQRTEQQQQQQPGTSRVRPSALQTPTAVTSGGSTALPVPAPARVPARVPVPASEQLRFKTSSSQVEQTSSLETSSGGQRITTYQYSSNVAQYTESYLLRQQQQQQITKEPTGRGGGSK